MKRLIVAAIGSAVLAFAVPGAYASEDSEYERQGWADLERIQNERSEMNEPRASAYDPNTMPYEQTELDRSALGIVDPERVLVAQAGGTSYRSGEDSESPFANDHNFIAPAQ